MKKLLLLMLVALAVTACKKEDDYELNSGSRQLIVYIAIENGQGEDMLAPLSTQCIDTAKVAVFGVTKDNQKYPIVKPLMYAARGFVLTNDKHSVGLYEGKYVFELHVQGNGENNQFYTMCIQWPDKSEDRFVAHIERHETNGGVRIPKLVIDDKTFDIPQGQAATFKKVIDGQNVTFVQLFHP